MYKLSALAVAVALLQGRHVAVAQNWNDPSLYAGVNFNDQSMYNLPFFQAFVASPALISARLDPIMSPGQAQSAHVHDIFGGGGFQPNWDYNAAINSGCSQVAKKLDFSNYWFPALYHQSADGQFTKVDTELRLYYHWTGQRTMFPHGFKMVTGNALSRSDDGSPVAQDVKWRCNGVTGTSMALPKDIGSCGGEGLVTKIHFPSCMKPGSTGATFDPKNPNGQVTFPTDGPEGTNCPSGYTLIPSIMLEIFFHNVADLASKGSAAQAFTFAHGDTTGFGFHADFVNGWVDAEGSLSSAVATGCKEGFGGNTCVTKSDSQQCALKDQSVGKGENAQNPGNKLLGCNPIWPATADCQTTKPGQNSTSSGQGTQGATVPQGGNTTPTQPQQPPPAQVAGAPVTTLTQVVTVDAKKERRAENPVAAMVDAHQGHARKHRRRHGGSMAAAVGAKS